MTSLRYRYPGPIGRLLHFTDLRQPLDEILWDDDYIVTVDRCEKCCVKKRLDTIGTIPDSSLVAIREGITKRGMEEAWYDEIEVLSRVIIKAIRK